MRVCLTKLFEDFMMKYKTGYHGRRFAYGGGEGGGIVSGMECLTECRPSRRFLVTAHEQVFYDPPEDLIMRIENRSCIYGQNPLVFPYFQEMGSMSSYVAAFSSI